MLIVSIFPFLIVSWYNMRIQFIFQYSSYFSYSCQTHLLFLVVFFFYISSYFLQRLYVLWKKKNDSFTSSFPKQVLFIYFLAILQSLEYNVEQKWWKLYPWTVFWKEEIIHNFTMHDVICNASQIRLWVENLLMLDCKSTHIGFCQVVFLCLLRWYVFFS